MNMFRDLTRQENTLIRREFNRWGIYNYIQDKVFVIKESQNNNNELFVIPLILKDFIYCPYSCYGGVQIGILQKKNFLPSITFFSIVAKYGNSFLYVIVSCNAEKLILYGKDIFGESIIYASPDIKQNSVILILNKSKEFLGIGRSRYQATRIKENGKVTINTLFDLGMYLRCEKKDKMYP
jgi:60S ribosome subunit biogenesis protein NIP7